MITFQRIADEHRRRRCSTATTTSATRSPMTHGTTAPSHSVRPTEAPDPMRLADRTTPSQPPSDAADRARRVDMQAELERSRCAAPPGRTARSTATLTCAEHVEAAEGDGERAQQRVVPQPAEALGQLLLERPALRRRRRRAAGWPLGGDDREHEPGRRRRTCRRRTRSAARTRSTSSRLASGGPTNWLATISAEYIRPLARSRSSVVDDRRHERLGAVVVEHLARAEQQRGDEDHDVQEPLGADDRARPRRAPAMTSLARPARRRATSDGEHGTGPTLAPTIRRRRSWRSVMTPAGSVNSSHGRRWTTATRAISSGLRVIAVASHG